MLMIDTVDVHRTLPFFIHRVNIGKRQQRVVFRHKAAPHVLAQVEAQLERWPHASLLHHVDIPQEKVLRLIVQLKPCPLHVQVSDGDE